MPTLRAVTFMALALPAFAQSQLLVVTKDGQRHAYNLQDVARIEFGSASVPPPPPPPPPPPSSTGSWLDTFLGGKVLTGEARQGSKVWPMRIRVTSRPDGSGNWTGEVTWTSLNCVHRVRGRLSGSSLTFTEVEAIRAGSAHLNVAYTLQVSGSGAKGTWVDPADRSTGTAVILDH